jgi:chromosome segregation ATPase
MKSEAASSSSSSSSNDATEKSRKKLIDKLESVKDEEKINYLINRILSTDSDAEKAKNEAEKLRQINSQNKLLSKKVDSLETLLSKTEVSKSKLEHLCRELQTRNKQQEQAHQQTVEAFKKSLGDIQKSVDARKDQHMPNVEQLSANLNDLASEYDSRLKDLKKLYEDREDSIHTIAKAKEEEISILRTELDGMQAKIHAVFEENVNLKRELLRSEEKVKRAIESELALRKMVDTYSEKYSSLMKNLANSNEAFDKMKKEMTKMNGNLIKVETDSRKKKTQLEDANKMVLALTAEKLEYEKTLSLKDRQLSQLQELCRRLQHQPANGESDVDANSHNTVTNSEVAQTN